MSKVRIVQLLCPQRHCIVATAYETPHGEPIPEITDRLQQQFQQLCDKAGIKHSCGICRSTTLLPEDKPTIFRTMDEAMPFLQESSDAQAATRQYLRASRS